MLTSYLNSCQASESVKEIQQTIGAKRVRLDEEEHSVIGFSEEGSTSPTRTPLSVSSPRQARQNTSNGAGRRVTFSNNAIEETTHEIFGLGAEIKYFKFIFSGKFNLADEMRRQGLVLSASQCTFHNVNKILCQTENFDKILDQLIKYQPHVFGQKYRDNMNIFKDANPACIAKVLYDLKHDHNIKINAYREHLRKPFVNYPDQLYFYARPNRALEMIELAEASGKEDEIQKCYMLPFDLIWHNLEVDTILTKAVKNMDLKRMELLLMRSDAVTIFTTPNNEGYDAFDLAIELFDKDLDPEYSIFCFLMKIISIAYKNNTVNNFETIVENIFDHCCEADKREILLEALEEELSSAMDYAIHNEVGDIQEDFIRCVDDQISKLESGDF